tara:strand:+ start:17026 stop:17295 length:270 start_codon:yes stop_codon:yes gene_type:complete
MKLKETVNYKSSTISSSTYDYTKNILLVTFNNKTSYKYENVLKETYHAFRDADSQGKALSTYIRYNEDIKTIKIEPQKNDGSFYAAGKL